MSKKSKDKKHVDELSKQKPYQDPNVGYEAACAEKLQKFIDYVFANDNSSGKENYSFHLKKGMDGMLDVMFRYDDTYEHLSIPKEDTTSLELLNTVIDHMSGEQIRFDCCKMFRDNDNEDKYPDPDLIHRITTESMVRTIAALNRQFGAKNINDDAMSALSVLYYIITRNIYGGSSNAKLYTNLDDLSNIHGILEDMLSYVKSDEDAIIDEEISKDKK